MTMLGRMLEPLARMIPARQRANPAGEGNVHPGPYTVQGGVLSRYAGQFMNWWQMDLDPTPMPGCSTIEACVWAYISSIAQLPGYHKREQADGGTETITTSALCRLLNHPNDYQTPSDFLVHLIRSLLYNGNSYWVAQRNAREEVTALHWTDPRMCRVREFPVAGQPFNEIFYDIGASPLINSTGFTIPARDVLHIKLATPAHPLIGETWISELSTELRQRRAIIDSLYSSSTNRSPGVVSTEQQLTPVQLDDMKDLWDKASARMKANGTPIMLTRGLKFQALALSAQDQQIIEQLKLNDRAIAACFGVPAILLGIVDTGTQKSAEAVMTEWLSSRLGWLINHIEVAFDHFLGINQGAVGAAREWTEYDTRMLLRSLFKERMDGLVKAVQGGIYSPNEARALEGYGKAKDGDEPRVQMQVVPLSYTKTPKPPAPPAAPPPPADAKPEPPDNEPGEDGQPQNEDRSVNDWKQRLAA